MIGNNKGFAISSIIYSMLVLFLSLVLLIMSNLASRKVIFDKQKNEILDKINNSELNQEKINAEARALYGLYYVSNSFADIFRISPDKVPTGFYNDYNDFSYYNDSYYFGSVYSNEKEMFFLNNYQNYLIEIANYIFDNYDCFVGNGEKGFFLEGWTTSASKEMGIKITKNASNEFIIDITCNC